MTTVSVSLWLPVGRANFYSVTANGWLRGESGTCSSRKLDDPKYVPVLQCSVLRRLLEVMPRSFGYDGRGEYITADIEGEPEETGRPTAVTMTLTDITGGLGDEGTPRHRANHALAAAGVRRVRLRVDEHGSYAFTADVDAADPAPAQEALTAHVCEVFGGGFDVKRLEPQPRRGFREGAAAVRRYNGLTDEPKEDSDQDPILDVIGPPLGALTFFQLNTALEGVCNLTLSPAVFFERYRFVKDYVNQEDTAVTIVQTVGQFIGLVATQEDGTAVPGQIGALRHFLGVTSRETLQRIKWSVESVRRNLLNEMMSALHRQSRLVQLDLASIKRERSPELASDASETQLRGFVTLVAAKLPLIANVYEVAKLASDHFTADGGRTHHTGPAHDLHVALSHWKLLLNGLTSNVAGLEKAVEQAWMERLLYEQQQARSEQEAISEIERSRFGRPAERGGGGPRSAYDSVNLIFTLLSILFVVATTNPQDVKSVITGSAAWQQLLPVLWPIAVAAFLLYVVIPLINRGLRWRRERRGSSGSHSYEFAFVLDESTEPKRVKDLLLPRGRVRLKTTGASADLRALALTRRGGGRMERLSIDASSIKMHSVLTFRVAFLHYARFEVVHEIRASRVSDDPRYLLHQVRVFGDSPRPLAHKTIAALVDTIHLELVKELITDQEYEDPLNLLREFYD